MKGNTPDVCLESSLQWLRWSALYLRVAASGSPHQINHCSTSTGASIQVIVRIKTQPAGGNVTLTFQLHTCAEGKQMFSDRATANPWKFRYIDHSSAYTDVHKHTERVHTLRHSACLHNTHWRKGASHMQPT